MAKQSDVKVVVLRALTVLEKSMLRSMRKHQDEGLTQMADLVKKELEKITAAQAWVQEFKDGKGEVPVGQ